MSLSSELLVILRIAAGLRHSCPWVRGGVHPGRVASISQDWHTETDEHSHLHSYQRALLSHKWTACLWMVGRETTCKHHTERHLAHVWLWTWFLPRGDCVNRFTTLLPTSCNSWVFFSFEQGKRWHYVAWKMFSRCLPGMLLSHCTIMLPHPEVTN